MSNPQRDLPVNSLLDKLKSIRGMKELLHKAVLLYVLLLDADVPTYVKAVVIAALLYLIDPLDAIPDLSPFVGLLDDLAVIVAALSVISGQIHPHHESQAQSFVNDL
ncbi:YkvA family protein [Marinobacterium maritimum]|uniref:YkvA family protein n=1 Tax=Marinobacterium maritimum TaxID=500162 RepID=A0ABP3TAE7_9GAMM